MGIVSIFTFIEGVLMPHVGDVRAAQRGLGKFDIFLAPGGAPE
jgi:hypothetical protein